MFTTGIDRSKVGIKTSKRFGCPSCDMLDILLNIIEEGNEDMDETQVEHLLLVGLSSYVLVFSVVLEYYFNVLTTCDDGDPI